MAGIRAIGETDPRGALYHALRLQPDAIYFLTDGIFTSRVQRELRAIKQTQVEIHTFVFGNRAGEELMKTIAASNGGRYKYVP